MRKRRPFAAVLWLAAALAAVLAACGPGEPEAGGSPAPSESAGQESASPAPSESAGQESSSPTPPAGAESPFTPGTWLSDGGQYYFFDEDGEGGRTASLEDGTGVGFTYTWAGEEASFALGAEDARRTCALRQEGEDLLLTWEDGSAERLTYVSEAGSEDFHFYSNLELAQMALDYYRAVSGGEGGDGLTAAAQTNEDGTVTIQIYENLVDHNSTADWYTVDRFTALGTNILGEEVDLTEGT